MRSKFLSQTFVSKAPTAFVPLAFAVLLTLGFGLPSHAATGAGADTGTAESSVRIPRSNESMGPADSASTVRAPISQVPAKKNSFDELSVSVGNETYVSRTSNPNQTSSFNEISARIRKKSQGPVLTSAIDAGASVAANANNYSNIEVPEAYFRLELPKTPEQLANEASGKSTYKHLDLTVGRKKERWSGVDSDWSLGYVQPLNKFDSLRPTEQGLTGAFANAGFGPVNVTLYGSALYIPEQGAPYDLKNGKFTTSSPWFSTPPEALIILSQQRPAKYTLAMPEISKIVNQTSFGGRVRLADPDGTGFYAQGTFLRKPQNAVALSFEGHLSIADQTQYGDVTVLPEIIYHTITGADIGYASEGFATEVSVVQENPDQPTLASNITTLHLNPQTIWSPSVEVRAFPTRSWGPRLRLSYLDTAGGEAIAVGEYAQNGNLFGPRVTFRRALSSSISSTLVNASRWSMVGTARWVEDFEENGSVLMTDLGFGFGDSWKLAFQADLLGSRKPTSNTDTFIARFRANDRVAARLTYLF